MWRLIEDWWHQRGPEHWTPEDDEDVAYLRAHKKDAEEQTRRLRHDLAEELRKARRNVGRPINPPRTVRDRS